MKEKDYCAIKQITHSFRKLEIQVTEGQNITASTCPFSPNGFAHLWSHVSLIRSIPPLPIVCKTRGRRGHAELKDDIFMFTYDV